MNNQRPKSVNKGCNSSRYENQNNSQNSIKLMKISKYFEWKQRIEKSNKYKRRENN